MSRLEETTGEIARPNTSVGLVQDSLFPEVTAAKLTLTGKFGVPPFSFLDSSQGYWSERKNDWLSLGLKSELGREGGLVRANQNVADSGYYIKKRAVEKTLGREISNEEFEASYYNRPEVGAASGTSVFDPVLCEVAYRWFCPHPGTILDPFAGGSVRGIVAGKLGFSYLGIDLREEQVASNYDQLAEIAETVEIPEPPRWVHGDSRNLLLVDDLPKSVDLVFSCPPYFDLEVYSDDPADLSVAESYEEFLAAYGSIIGRACSLLAPNRFAVWVVSDVRDKRGIYRGLARDTITLFEEAGLGFYNEAVLVSPVASASVRASKQFQAGRKLVRRHQSVLVFFKGDPGKIKETFGEVVVDDAWR